MKKIKNKVFNTTFGIAASALVAPLFGAAVNAANAAPITYSTNDVNNVEMSPEDFLSSPVKNNLIENDGGPDYHFQSALTDQQTNDPNTYNKENVLSDDAIKIVRNENFYFNFIKSPNANTYHIMITPTNLNSELEPIKTVTNFKETNGSALWIEDHLVVVGTNVEDNFLLQVYSQDQTTGQLSLEDNIIGTATTNPELKALVDLTLTAEFTSPMSNNGNMVDFEPYQNFTNPIYLSPVTDYTNSDGFEIVVWSGQRTMGDMFSSNGRKPILIKYTTEGGIQKSVANPQVLDNNIELPIHPGIALDPEGNPTTFTSEQMLAARVAYLTPIRNALGQLSYYFFNLIGTAEANSIYGITAQASLANNNQDLNIVQFSSDVDQLVNNSRNFLITRDVMDYVPYGLVARGDANNPTNTSQTANILININRNIVQNSAGALLSLVINGIDSNLPEINVPLERKIGLWTSPNGPIVSSVGTFIDSIYYSNGNDLNEGIQIGVKYTGLAPNLNITRVGIITWKRPWDENFWSREAFQSGSLFYGYSAYGLGVGIGPGTGGYYFEDIAVTVWDNTYTAIGIYEPRTIEGDRQAVKAVTKNVNNQANVYNTQIPNNITLNDIPNFSPSFLGVNGIIEIIQNYSKDFPSDFFTVNFENFDFEDTNGGAEFGNSLFLNGELINYYQNGFQSEEWLPLNINLSINHLPSEAEIANPFGSNNILEIKSDYPSAISIPINEAYSSPGMLTVQDGIIGYDSNSVLQVAKSMSPFISDLKATPNDFLGQLKIDYKVTSAKGVSQDHSLTINLFWGNVYIIAIVIGSVILIGLTIFTVFALQRKKSKEKLSQSLSTGFNLFKVNSTKGTPTSPKAPSTSSPKMTPPGLKPGPKAPSTSSSKTTPPGLKPGPKAPPVPGPGKKV